MSKRRAFTQYVALGARSGPVPFIRVGVERGVEWSGRPVGGQRPGWTSTTPVSR